MKNHLKSYSGIYLLALTIFGLAIYVAYQQFGVIYPEAGLNKPSEVALLGPKEAYPNHETNPGLLSVLDPNKTCLNPNWRTSSVRPGTSYTNALKIRQIGEYGYTDANPQDYEEDHIVSLEACGNPTDPRNLWPEKYHIMWNGQDVGAHTKDKVENAVASDIKAGKISVQEGADRLSGDWIAAGIKYGILK